MYGGGCGRRRSEDARNATEQQRTPYWAMPARSPETSISTSNSVRVASSSEQPTERYAGASRSARNRSRSSDESQTVMACSLPSTARRQPSGGTGPELRTCLLISSYCSSVRLVSSMMLQMAIRASSVGFENDRRSARSADHQCDCGFGTERLLNMLPRPRRELRAVVQPGLGEHVTDVALDRSHGEMQVRGDRLVGQALGHQMDDFELTSTQAGLSRRARPGGPERLRDRIVDAEAGPLGPDPLGVGADGALAHLPHASQTLAKEAREIA